MAAAAENATVSVPRRSGIDMQDINLVCHSGIIKGKRARRPNLEVQASGLNFKLKAVLGCVWFLRLRRGLSCGGL